MTKYVLKPSTVRAAVEDLQERRIHPHFPTYLGLVRYSEQHGVSQDMNYPYAEYLDEKFRVEASPGRNMVVGSSEKPYLNPFHLKYQDDAKWTGNNWDQQVSPGTAGRSSAQQGLHKVADMDTDAMTYSLKNGHVEKAFRFLAMEEKIPAIPVGAFLYRNDAFQVEESEPSLSDVEEIFREEYGFQDDEDFNTLFIEDYDLDVSNPFEVYDD